MSTYIPKVSENERQWYLIDASDVVLGKLAVSATNILTGKRKPTYTPFLDTGDHVIVINAAKLTLTGRKETSKFYHRHSGFPGDIKSASAAEVRKKKPARLVESAIRGMLPKTKLGRAMYGKLKVYAGPEHPHKAQKPQTVAV